VRSKTRVYCAVTMDMVSVAIFVGVAGEGFAGRRKFLAITAPCIENELRLPKTCGSCVKLVGSLQLNSAPSRIWSNCGIRR